eukprot:1157339-Pelagomonas_calceolata.AAC.1
MHQTVSTKREHSQARLATCPVKTFYVHEVHEGWKVDQPPKPQQKSKRARLACDVFAIEAGGFKPGDVRIELVAHRHKVSYILVDEAICAKALANLYTAHGMTSFREIMLSSSAAGLRAASSQCAQHELCVWKSGSFILQFLVSSSKGSSADDVSITAAETSIFTTRGGGSAQHHNRVHYDSQEAPVTHLVFCEAMRHKLLPAGHIHAVHIGMAHRGCSRG